MKAIVTGMIATYPLGGVAWDYGQYAVGLEQLGMDVFYLEDTGAENYNPVKGEYGADCSVGIRFLQESLDQFSPNLGKRWHFRALDNSTYGIGAAEFQHIVEKADLFLNVSGGTLLRDEYMRCPCKILIDTDPGWNHFVNYPKWDANPNWHGTHGFRSHDHFFTYAERIGANDCNLPDMGIHWHATRPPVVMECWEPSGQGTDWTTVMTWNNFRKPVEYQGRLYGSKEMEFPKVEQLPQHLPKSHFELAVGGNEAPTEHWRRLGWKVIDSHSVSRTMNDYRDYIQGSRGEFSVAKNLYTATKSGWFSCRSACYLAAGRPCVVQDTGFKDTIPTGEGLLTWTTLAEAQDAVREIESDYAFHQRRAREIAAEYLDAKRVIGDMLYTVGL